MVKEEGKKEKKLEAPSCDSFFQSSLAAAKAKFGDNNAYVISEHKLFGVPLDNLALMYVIDGNVWPLGRVTMTHGVEQSGKSAFFHWLLKKYVQFGGCGALISAENKDSPSLMKSIIGEEMKRVEYIRATTIQEWQSAATQLILGYWKDHHWGTDAKGNKVVGLPGSFVLLLGVDALSGVADETAKEAIDEQGYANGRQFPVGAAATTYYMKAVTSNLVGMPITFHCVDHVKQKIGDSHEEQGRSTTAASSRPAGAAHTRFANSLDLWFTRGKTVWTAERRGFVTNISVYKSSLGDAKRNIDAELSWVPDDNAPGGQRTWWNWDAATAELLKDFKSSKKPGDKSSPIFDVIDDFVVTSGVYSSKRLGKEKLSAAEFGHAINSDEQLLAECAKALSIHKYETFTAGGVR